VERLIPAGLDALILLVTALLSWLMPSLTRQRLLFGVTVPVGAGESPVGRGIIARYRVGVLGVTLLAALCLVALYAFTSDDFWVSVLPSVFVLLAVCAFSIPYLFAHAASRRLATPAMPGEGDDAPLAPTEETGPRGYGDYVPWVWEALPLAIIAATAGYLVAQYPAAPARIATHFDAAGRANGFAEKSILTYFALVWSQIALEGVLLALGVLVAHARAIPGAAAARFRALWLRYLYGLRLLVLAFFGGIAVVVALSANGTPTGTEWILPATIVLVVFVLGGAVLLALRTGQGGSRLGSIVETGTDRSDDRFWKLGAIYVNPRDPSIFVERRFGIGWTINLGNPRGLALLAALLAVPVGSIVLATLLGAAR
jgi:uncharacterized membrane protein